MLARPYVSDMVVGSACDAGLGDEAQSMFEIWAPAKLNLYLDVLGRRDDGFHELETLMAPVRIFDRLRWRSAAALSFSVNSATRTEVSRAIPGDESNLVVRSARLLADSAGISPRGRFELWKAIPAGAGMGGGSSDAAATLLLANRAWGINYPTRRLAELAAKLGSDVPFFLAGGPAICRGRGERVNPVRGLPLLHAVVVKPSASVSTRDAFDGLKLGSEGTPGEQSAERVAKLISHLRVGALERAGREMFNRLEAAATMICESVATVLKALASHDCYATFMTGSGSACVGLCRTATQARRIARHLLSRQFSMQEISNQLSSIRTTSSGTPSYRTLSSRTLGKVWATSTCH